MKRIILILALALSVQAQTSFPNSYYTRFPSTENPISENGRWINGAVTGGANFHNMRTTANAVFGTQPGGQGNCSGLGDPACGDSTAILTGTWGATQAALGIVYVIGTPSNFSEVELRLRTTITNDSITGYEFLCSVVPGNQYMQIVRWNGPLGNFNLIDSRNVGCANGDVLAATAIGSTLTIYKNGTAIFSVTDATFTNGSPGVGHYATNTTGQQNYGFSYFSAGQRLAATCNSADIIAAQTAASNFDTILVPPGSCTLASVTFTKPVKWLGSYGTNWTMSGGTQNTVTKSSSGVIWMENFTFALTGAGELSTQVGFAVQDGAGGWKGSYPFVFYKNTGTINAAEIFLFKTPGGVIASTNTITGLGGNLNVDSIFVSKDPVDAANSWGQVDTLGARDNSSTLTGTIPGTSGFLNHYLENNTLNNVATSATDIDDSSRVVFRYNNLTNAEFNTHGFGSSPVGIRQFEIYNNDFKSTCAETGSCPNISNLQNYIWIRGGFGVIHDNVADNLKTGFWGPKPEAALAQDSNHDAGCPVDGSSYPLKHQIGQNNNGVSDFTDPVWLWNNTVRNTGQSPFVWDTSVGWFYACVPSITLYLQAGRDYVDNSANSTAKPGYAPFTYPHPILGGVVIVPSTTASPAPAFAGLRPEPKGGQ